MKQLETMLDKWLVKKAPFQIPVKGKENLVKYMPVISLIVAVLSLFAAWSLYQAAMFVEQLGTSVYSLYGSYAPSVTTNKLSTIVWFGIAVLLLEAVLLFMAYPGLKAKNKKGWYMLYYVAAANVVYALAYLFMDQNVGSFLMSLAGSVAGLYILFQIRSYYMGEHHTKSKK